VAFDINDVKPGITYMSKSTNLPPFKINYSLNCGLFLIHGNHDALSSSLLFWFSFFSFCVIMKAKDQQIQIIQSFTKKIASAAFLIPSENSSDIKMCFAVISKKGYFSLSHHTDSSTYISLFVSSLSYLQIGYQYNL